MSLSSVSFLNIFNAAFKPSLIDISPRLQSTQGPLTSCISLELGYNRNFRYLVD